MFSSSSNVGGMADAIWWVTRHLSFPAKSRRRNFSVF